MNIADQISAKRAEIGQMERNMRNCQRGLNYFSTGEDRTVFISYKSTHGWQGGTVIISPDVAEKAINAQLELLKIEIEKAEQELQNLINS